MADTATKVPLATTTLSSTATSVTFSSISGSYTDIILIINAKASSGDQVRINFNSDTATNYSSTYLFGSGSAAYSGRGSSMSAAYAGYISTEFQNVIAQINNYANSTTYKTFLSRANDSAVEVATYASLWRSTSAITTIGIKLDGTKTFASGSTFTLYGIL